MLMSIALAALSQETSSSPPLLTVTGATPRHSPLKQSVSNSTIIPSSSKSGSPRVIQRLAIRRTESATVIRKVSPSPSKVNRGLPVSSQSLHRHRSQSTSSVSKPAAAKAASSAFDHPHDLDTDSSGECSVPIAAASLPDYSGPGHLLTSSDPNLARSAVQESWAWTYVVWCLFLFHVLLFHNCPNHQVAPWKLVHIWEICCPLILSKS